MIQLFSAALYNLNVKGFAQNAIYRGPTKGLCVPGLNCYSCPGAIAACPLGALQSALNNLPALPLYVLGTLAVFGALLGRAVCAFLCPIGLLQELLYKIPSPKIPKGRWSRRLSGMKYAVLAVFVIGIPLYTLAARGVVVPGFCKWICPAGTLEGGIGLAAFNEQMRAQLGGLFGWKVAVLAALAAAAVFVYRPFCRFICPLGAIYSLFNRIAIFGIRVDEGKCTHCGLCVRSCRMDVKRVNDRECIRCGECMDRCPSGALCSGCHKRKGIMKHEEIADMGAGSDLPERGGAGGAGH